MQGCDQRKDRESAELALHWRRNAVLLSLPTGLIVMFVIRVVVVALGVLAFSAATGLSSSVQAGTVICGGKVC
jgi:hypothetical protein